MKPEKAWQWQEMATQFANVTDRLGKPIDAGIKETVIALNILGMHTKASCEGHLSWGIAAPWIDVSSPEVADESARYALMQEGEEKDHLRTLIRQKNMAERKKLLSSLSLFYENRLTSAERRLIICNIGLGTSRLQSQGADLQAFEPPAIQAQKLQEYQEEMREFTLFLKHLWEEA